MHMIITAKTDHGGLQCKAKLEVRTLPEFATALEKGLAGPIYVRTCNDDHLREAWMDLCAAGHARYGFTTFTKH